MSFGNSNSTKNIERDAESMGLSSSASSRSQSQEIELGKGFSDEEREENTSNRPDEESDAGEELDADGETSELRGDLPPISEHIDLKKIMSQNRETLSGRRVQRINHNHYPRG